MYTEGVVGSQDKELYLSCLVSDSDTRDKIVSKVEYPNFERHQMAHRREEVIECGVSIRG